MISGTVQKGHIFKMQSGSIYEVAELTIQVVVAVSPKALVLSDGRQFKLTIEGLDEPLICKQLASPKRFVAKANEQAKSTTPFKAGDYTNIPLGKLMSEAQQRQMGIYKLTKQEQERLRIYLIELYFLGVENGRKEAPESMSRNTVSSSAASAIESQIEGNFKGWEGETVVKLVNGQIWQQAEYYYHYHYAVMPKVLVYKSGDGYKMKVDGIDRSVLVKQLR